MSKPAGTTWTQGIKPPVFPKLAADAKTDIAIVGGGMVGILTAYLLSKTGKRVMVFEYGKYLEEGATERTTAFLTHVIDTDPTDLISMYGKSKARQIWLSHKIAIDQIEKIIQREKIKCEFTRCSNYNFANDEDEYSDLKEELKAIRQMGFKASLGNKNLGFNHAGYLELKDQAKFHPLKFLQAIIARAEQNGVSFFQDTEVLGVEGNKVKTQQHVVTANQILIATYDPLGNPKETFAKKGMYRSYVFELNIPRGTIKEGIYEDMRNPYHYFRVDKGPKHDRLIIGGEDNRSELALDSDKNFAALKDFTRQLLGKTKFKIAQKWSGPILEPSDGLALIGQIKPRQYVAAAFSGNGMTYSMIAAILIRDLMLKKPNAWKNLYDPKRKLKLKPLLKKAKDYTEEFFGGVVKNILK